MSKVKLDKRGFCYVYLIAKNVKTECKDDVMNGLKALGLEQFEENTY